MRKSISLVATALILSLAGPASADEQARVHFEAGKKLRDEDNCAAAIPEFTQSLTAEKSIGAYYNLGFCHEKLGHRQEAYDAYRNAQQLASAKRDDRLREISGAIGALLETPHIRLVLPQPLPAGIVIKVDGDAVPEAYYQAETVIFTKGSTSHSVVVSAPGYEDRTEMVDTKQVRPIELRHPNEPPPAPPVTTVAPRTGWSWQHWAGLGVIVVGAGLVTASTVMFVDYKSEESRLLDQFQQADAVCTGDGNPACPSDAAKLERDRLRDAYNSNEEEAVERRPLILTLGIGGLLAIGGGIALFATAPPTARAPSPNPGDKARPSLRVTPLLGSVRGVAVGGTF